MNVLPLILQILSGAIAANIGCSAFPNIHLGFAGNSVIGIVGGGIGGQILERLCTAGYGATDTQIFLCSIAGGAVGGVLLTAIVALIRNLVRGKR
jgi:uncharacterized membrane protein YeaQ/YmgE (transglycosylase-associated protein family)